LDPSQWWDPRADNWISILSEFTCQYSHSCQSCCSSITILPWSKVGRIFSQVLCTSGILVVGWRR
jgi:hypothetical protein